MSDHEFAVIAARLVWGEDEAEPTPQETIKRLKALVEERDLFLRALKDLSQALLASARWAEGGLRLTTALLWGLYALQDRQELLFKSASASSPDAPQRQA